jgi:hypothetical protein
MTWEQYVGALVLAMVYVRLAWMIARPRHHQRRPATAPVVTR